MWEELAEYVKEIGVSDLVIGKMDTMANEVEGDFEVS